MANKYEMITQLADYTAGRILKDPHDYMGFLRCAGQNYKYSFQDQILIYAQKPDATACAEFETWKELGRYVNRGTKGIALLVDDGYRKLRHVFDIADTNSFAGRKVYVWQMENRFESTVMEALNNSFGPLDDSGGFLPLLIAAASNAVEDNLPDYLLDLEDMKGVPSPDTFKALLANSVIYMVMHRCGMEPDTLLFERDFQGIDEFASTDSFMILGCASSSISEMLLREIGDTVRNMEITEKKRNRTFAMPSNNRYNDSNKTNEERGNDHGTDLPQGGRLPVSQPKRPDDSPTGEIRQSPEGVSEESPESPVHLTASDGQAEQPSGGDRPAGREHDGDSDREDDQGRGTDGGAESPQPDGMGTEDEQHSSFGGRDGERGTDLQLTPPEEQSYIPTEAEDEKASAFTFSQESIDTILTHGSGVHEGKYRIFEQYLKKESTEDNVRFLKDEYGIGGSFPAATIDGISVSEDHDGKGIRLRAGSIINPMAEVLLKWPQIAKRIGQLIEVDRYLNAAEKAYYPEYHRSIVAREERSVICKEFISIVRDFNDFQEQLDRKDLMLNQYQLSDCGYCFSRGEKKSMAVSKDGVFIIPIMREAMKTVLDANTHLNDRASSMLAQLSGVHAQKLEPTYDELNPPPEIPKEYRYSMGDTVYLGSQEYEVLFIGEEEVRLYDASFPLINKVVPRSEFDSRLKENPLNDHLLVESVTPMENLKNTLSVFDREAEQMQEAKDLINDFYVEEYQEEADFSDPFHVALAYSTTEDSRHDIEVEVSLPEKRIIFFVDRDIVSALQCASVDDLNAYLANLEFDQLISFAEAQWKQQQEKKPLIGRIDYLATSGVVGESIEYSDANRFEQDVRENNYNGVPMTVILYRDENGNTIPHDFIAQCDPPLNGFAIEERQAKKEEITEPVSEPVPEPLTAPEQPKPLRSSPQVLHPEIPTDQRHSYAIEDNDIGVGTPGERYQHNITAIRLLKTLEEENRLANPEEQSVLAEYVGWGGLADCFEEKSSHYGELKALLTEEEYDAARESTLTAFYTPPVVIRSIYEALGNLGFQTGNILEPACGIGNFMGLLPTAMQNSKLYGVELDSISGRIAQQLYQRNSIAVQGYEKTDLPDSFFDIAIGNVPFGQFKLLDKRYDKLNFSIHDYFFAKTLDKVRPGGVIAFVTSSFTMDKQNPTVRKYIAQRAELLGAIRLPNNTFKAAAGTEVTSDILFLQKRDSLVDIQPDWVHLNTDENGIRMNQYFIDNPDMILGEMKEISGPYGPEPACVPYADQSLEELLHTAIANINGQIWEYDFDELVDNEEDQSIPADPNVRNFSYALADGKIYYRENSRMTPAELSATAESRIKGMIAIRDSVRTLIEYQTEDHPDSIIKAEQLNLNQLYDSFSAKYGIINSRANSSAFSADSSFCLLSSLEILDDEGNFLRKADMFSKRTIKQKVIVTSVDTASEALALSLAEKAKIDMSYMMELTGKSEAEIFSDLKGVIFLNPQHVSEEDSHPKYLPADEYLSGNVREKLSLAIRSAELYPDDYTANVEALKAVQPIDLTASEISVRLGATWLPTEDVEDFMFGLLSTPRYCQWNIHVHYSKYTGEWNIEGKSYDRNNVKAGNTYGTDRVNAYKIIEETLNLRDVRIFDYIEDGAGKKIAVLNKKETAIAQGKQEQIKQAFAEWIWKDPERRKRLCKLYNEQFNSIRPREYDGSHLNFVGINPEISLRSHQVNAIAHILYGGNTLLAHVVGAGKTFEMVAAAQESKRLGLCQKSLFVVPNHLTEQWASEYLQLYPSANILVATKKDFETKNRKKFCGRIATGDYDAVIIGHSQFEKIPMSIERQRMILEQQMDEIMDGIRELKQNRGDRFSIKQMERTKKSVQAKLEKLNDQTRKDDVVTFEELGVDRLFIDEAHYYKNLAAFTKMRNVGGISQTEAMKSSDLYMKCRYLDELTGGRGVVFATGTPISNSMVEMYTMQKYLQYNTLRRNDLIHFDAWASTFGETVTAIELSPEGTGYRAKTRFAKFYNLPELIAMFKETADIQTADMLKLPVPEAHYHSVVLKPSETQAKMVHDLSERAERVRNKMVDSTVDNMLLITNDGRKLALDQRLMNDMLPDSDTSKVSACADNVFSIWEKSMEKKSTQIVFCDLSTPHNDGKFNVYDDLRDKLIAKGIPKEEIAYIHTANTETAKKELFGKVRSGQVRVLIGSTQKMGAGTNVQTKLAALHHLDCPWRPSDLQQREGRIIRQGNENPDVDIYTYVTENTFDSYLYQLVESKQKFIGQIMTSKSPVRSAEDIDETALSYAEIKALCAGDPRIKEKMDLDIEVQKLKLLKASHLSQRYDLEDRILTKFPKEIALEEQRIQGYEADIKTRDENTHPNDDGFSPMIIKGFAYDDKKEAGQAILDACKAMKSPEAVPIGQYRGFDMGVSFDTFNRIYEVVLKGQLHHRVALGSDIFGNIQRLDNMLSSFEQRQQECHEKLENAKVQLKNAKLEVQAPFPREEEYVAKSKRLEELNIALNLDKRDNEIVDDGDRNAEKPQSVSEGMER